MIPIGESVTTRRQPVVTIALIVVCVLVFLYELTLRGPALDAFVTRFGAVPKLVVAALAGDPRVPRIELLTLLTSQFIHAGFLHLAGNVVFLWVFGRAVEDRLGPAVFLSFYLLTGVLAGLVQCVISSNETVPLIGASGAIAGVLGLYFIAYPTAWVRVLMPVLFFFWTFDLPALLVLAFWFVSQFFAGVASITQATRATAEVAVWAHIAGFAIGAGAHFVLPGRAGTLTSGARPSMSRADAPGPARLVSSVADLVALLLGARLALRFFGLLTARSPLAFVALPVGAVTEPVVGPIAELLPTVRVLGGVLELYTLVAIVAVYILAGLIGQLFLHPVTVSFEWGEQGARALTHRCEVLVVVDVLSFTTTTDIAASRGAEVLPFASRDAARAAGFAEQHHAELAARRGQGRYSLSPASVLDVPAGTRLVLPSPNGATISRLAADSGCTVVAGCLRNASAVTRFAAARGEAIGVIAAGERWPDQSLRVAIEDLLGAGAIIAALGAIGATTRTAEAETAARAFEAVSRRITSLVAASISGQELIQGGYPDDVALAVELDVSASVPVLRDGLYFSAT